MKQLFKNAVFMVVATVAIGLTTEAAIAAAYIKIGDIKGESTDRGHEEWSDVQSFGHSIARAETLEQRGRVEVKALKVGKELDKASPKIQESLLIGRAIPSVMLEFTRNVGGEEVVYLRYELTNVFLVGYTVNLGAADGETVPTEEFSLNFEEIKVTYTSSDKEVTEYTYDVAGAVAN